MLEEDEAVIPLDPWVSVKIVGLEGSRALVEDALTLRRVAIHAEAVINGMVRKSVLDEGIPYGVAWETLNFPSINAADVAFELRRHGLHTAGDVLKNPGQVSKAIQSAHARIVKNVLDFSRHVGGR